MQKITRHITIALIGIFLLISCKSEEKEIATKPNILFIMSDDHTSQAWGIYGGILQDYVQNKNIKRLAEEGAVLNNAFCTNSICVPSRASILTGQFSNKNGVYTLSDALNPDSLNIAKVLNKNGYQTAIIGKWHLKKEPSGFDYYNILHDQGRYWNPILRTAENFNNPPETWDVHEGFSTDVITQLSLDWLSQRDQNKPFMLMTHFKATHEPFDFPERYNDLYNDVEIPEPASLFDFSPETTGRSFLGQKLENLAWRYEQASNDPEKWWCKYPGLPFYTNEMDSVSARKATYQKFIKDFMRSGAAIDDNIGKLLDYLEASGLAENTIVIYTADQGYFLGEHGFFDKRLIYEESLRMPFVIRYPKEIAAGKRIDDIILNIDFPALFADYAGIEKPKSFQGQSFRKNLKGETPENWRTSAYYRYWTNHPIRPAHFGIRNKRYKLALFYGHSLDMTGSSKESTTPAWEFYDLEKDPNENYNAYNDSDYSEIIKDMKTALKNQRQAYGDTDVQYESLQDIFKTYWK
ncbi:sulfatase family protein [Hwangdonia lutea]|uniref:Sulfatase n=1 Tax=Hwangdonia lutea TaxID=3075823 RepID=A0AA97ELZ5_9FLAO|nr:sulfatase [Hwangdonia sp. SCSIO 19198]WOD42443.1 sulfatase [Hwangdonia sp. SCSIO 19198]